MTSMKNNSQLSSQLWIIGGGGGGGGVSASFNIVCSSGALRLKYTMKFDEIPFVLYRMFPKSVREHLGESAQHEV